MSATSPQVRNQHTVAGFIKMLFDAKAGPPPLNAQNKFTGKKRPKLEEQYVFSQIETHSKVDEIEWRDWRKKQIMPSASMIASWFNCGYRTLNKEFREITGVDQAQEPNPFLKKMLDHGNDHEFPAKLQYLNLKNLKEGEVEYLATGNTSYIFEVEKGGKTCQVLATPDMIIKVPDEKGSGPPKFRVVEIKCPAYGMVVNKLPFLGVLTGFRDCYPKGKVGHFLQAATYAFLFECDTFDVYYYFTDTINTGWVTVSYKMTEKLKDCLFEALQSCCTHLDRAKLNPESANYPLLRAKSNNKQIAEDLLEECFLCQLDGAQLGDLQEETSNDSEEQGP